MIMVTQSPRIGGILQARLDSTRLCHKVLKECPAGSGRTVLGCCLDAMLHAQTIKAGCLTTPDAALRALARYYWPGIHVQLWRGPRDPLAEYYTAASDFQFGVIVRLTGDCPMVTAEIIDAAVSEFLDNKADYGYNQSDGADVEVFTFDALAQAYEKAGPDEREHVTTWIRRHKRCVDLTPPAGEFLSLNTAAEYARICELMGRK